MTTEPSRPSQRLARRVTFVLHPHTNADRLSIAKIDGTDWQCVTATAQWGAVRHGVYIAIDALLDPVLPEFSFLADKATKKFADGRPGHRLKTVRLRGMLSQGLLIPWPDGISADADLDALLGIERYEPPIPAHLRGDQVRCPGSFLCYVQIENAKNHPTLFSAEDSVRVSEKVHGSPWRAGMVEDGRDELIYAVGTHRTARDPAGANLYSVIARRDVPEEKLRPLSQAAGARRNFVVYGEVFGSKVQDLNYGCAAGEQRLRLFDVLVDDVFQPWETVVEVAQALGLETVPVLYRGPFDREKVLALCDGPSTVPGATHVREGVVVVAEPEAWATCEASGFAGRKMLKYISDGYLERSGAKDGH